MLFSRVQPCMKGLGGQPVQGAFTVGVGGRVLQRPGHSPSPSPWILASGIKPVQETDGQA